MNWQPRKREENLAPAMLHPRYAAWPGLITIGGIIYFFVAVVVLHLLRPDYNPVNHAVSNYAVGPYGYLMTAAFYALALSVFALTFVLVRSIALSTQALVAVSLLDIAGVGMIVMGIFPGDAHALHPPVTITGVIHWAAAGVSFLSIMIAAFLLSSCFKTDKHWQAFQRPSYLLALAMVGALLLYGILALVGWIGIGQRIYLIVCLLWLLLMALWLQSVANSKSSTH